MMLNRSMMIFAMAILLIAGVWGSALAQTGDELIPIYEAGIEAWNAQDVDLLSSGWTDDIIGDYVPFGIITEGKEANIAFTLSFYESFPDIQWNTQRVLASENILAIEWIASGTHQGAFLDIPPTQIFAQTPHLTIDEYEGGKLKRVTHYLDYVTVLTQLGVMPAGELPPLVPSFTLPDPEPTGLAPIEAAARVTSTFNTHDLSLFMKIVHKDAEIYYAPLGVPIDRAAYAALCELYLLGFPDLTGKDVRQVDMGDAWVLTETVWRGTNDGPYFGIPASGRPSTTRSASLMRFDADGLMTDIRFYYDNLTVLTNIGVFPPPEPTAVSPASWGQIKARFR